MPSISSAGFNPIIALTTADARRPEKYRERQDVVQTIHGEMKVTADWSKLSPEEAATMVRLAEKKAGAAPAPPASPRSARMVTRETPRRTDRATWDDAGGAD